ncbi:hypothetical protein D6L34_25195 [Vibrio parahaemolyticus]|nr:hypothetical protein [Vibrio parahaemolyticus]EGR1629869.1 hypothetical protein [Vibrio parahaemolyticus]
MKEENQKLTRHEFVLSQEHQDRLDAMVKDHPTINTRVGMIRALIDSKPIEQTTVVRLDQTHVNQIARLGNLLNQYARLAYTYAASGEPISATVLHQKIDKANELLSKILREVRGDAA